MALPSPEQEAQVTADVLRAAIAYIRAVKNDCTEDEVAILFNVSPEHLVGEFPLRLAQVAVAAGEMTDEYLDGLLEGTNEVEATGWLADHIASLDD